MRSTSCLVLALALSAAACQSTSATPRVVEVDPEMRGTLFDAVAALEGRWEMEGPDGPAYVEFEVIANGSAVRETMFPGEDHEMVNMYTLAGNGLAMTHYCASGNQPHMRAAAIDGGALAFETTGVSDLKAADEPYMGSMTLVIVDADHIEQHWTTLNAPEEANSMVFAFTRVR